MIITLKLRWFLAHTILIILLIVLPYYLIFYEGYFEKKVEYRSYEGGSIDSPISYDIITKTNSPINQDYSMFINFESKGAFIAGREIKVSIDFLAVTSRINNSELIVVFPGALDYPIQKGNGLWNDASVTLRFVNESFAHGEKNIIYLMPEFYNESVIVFKRDNAKGSQILPAGLIDKYTYTLIINGTQQKENNFIRKNGFVYLSPLETSLQLDNNNLIVFLTFVAIYLAVLQVFLSIFPFSISKGQESK
jgi:hypothetical protein